MRTARAPAVVAAQAASSAAAELLRYFREGAACNRPFGLEDPIAELADALAIAIKIESDFLDQQPCYAEELSHLGQLLAAVRKWQSDVGAGPSVVVRR